MRHQQRTLPASWFRAALVGVTGLAIWAAASSPAGAAGPYTVPAVSRITGSVPEADIPALHFDCLVRAEPEGADVPQRLLCYGTVKPEPPPTFPPQPPFVPPVHAAISSNFDELTGELSNPLVGCFEFIPDITYLQVDLLIPLDKAGGPVSGSTTLTTDTTSPFDCADGTVDVGPLDMTPLAKGHDENQDGCSDWEELSDNENAGGLRDPFHFWDFYDVPTGTPLTRDKVVSGGDISAIVARFGANDANKTAPINRNTDPTTTPPATGYHPAYDRGGIIPGGGSWNLLPANGVVSGGDISSVLGQFGDTCAAAP